MQRVEKKKVNRRKVRQSMTFDPKLDAALRRMAYHVAGRMKTSFGYNNYVEGILSGYMKSLFGGAIPTVEEIDAIILKRKEAKDE